MSVAAWEYASGCPDACRSCGATSSAGSDERFAERFAHQWRRCAPTCGASPRCRSTSARVSRTTRRAGCPTGSTSPPRGPGASWCWSRRATSSRGGSRCSPLVVLPLVIALLLTALVVPLVDALRPAAHPARARVPDGGARQHRGGRAPADLRRPADRPRGQRPRPNQVVKGLEQIQQLAEDRPAARQRQPDQRLHPVRPGRRDLLEQARSSPG